MSLVFHSRQFWQRIATVYLIFALSGASLPIVRILMLFLGTANHLCVNLLITGLNTTDTSKRGAIMGLNSGRLYREYAFWCTLPTLGLYTAVGFVVISILFKHAIHCTYTHA
ncbi:hypothetical protein [Pectobacterium brasiliense]|uniref:hypothetical protein n=1 Tax=Pectobacterium brasiliense TaxID=180957 RepID=UPI00387394C3